MDPAPPGGDMSPLYVPRKRRAVQPRGGAPCPGDGKRPLSSAPPVQRAQRHSASCPAVVQRTPERVSVVQCPENDKPADVEAARAKRTSARKRYQDLQSVSMGTVDDPAPSCSVTSSGGLANGSEAGSVAPPTPREPELQRWAPGPDPPRDQVWGASRDQDQDQEQNRDQGQTWNGGPGPAGDQQGWTQTVQDQNWSHTSRERGDVWRPDLNLQKVHRAAPGSDSSQPAGGRSSGPDEDAQTSSSSVQDQNVVILPSRKEPPSYPAGSPEERWQLQIVARGRVTCPKCKSVSRKTVEGLKKHMENCRLQPFTCQHCGKQLKSSTGMKYHIMADHSHLPSVDDVSELDDRAIKDKLRKVLKRLGKLKCSKEGCGAAFSSIMGYVYHMKKCGKEEAELEKMLLSCSHCGKNYKSKAGLEYHLKSEHAPTPQKTEDDEDERAGGETDRERTASGRVQRASAQVANFHLAEIANNDLPKDWPKRKFQSDLVPDDKKLKYARPGLPAFSQEVLRKWKNEVKLQRKVQCPNQGCGCTYTSVSGLKAHLGLCTRGDFEAGKYRCLICSKEFNSESGVKYHINSVHSQEWFVTNKKASKKFEKFLKNQPKQFVHSVDKQSASHLHHLHLHQQHYEQHHHHHHPHHHHHHHHHPPPPQQLQPLQPLHHLQHQPQFLHPDRPCLAQQGEPPLLYTPLEPPAAAVWVEMEQRDDVPGPEQAPIEMELAVIDKEEEEEEQEQEQGGSRQTEPEGTV